MFQSKKPHDFFKTRFGAAAQPETDGWLRALRARREWQNCSGIKNLMGWTKPAASIFYHSFFAQNRTAKNSPQLLLSRHSFHIFDARYFAHR